MSRIIYTPRENKKIKRPSKKVFFGAVAVLVIILIITGVCLLLLSSRFQIKYVEVSGMEKLGAEDIKSTASEFLKGNYKFFIPRSSFFLAGSEDLSQKLQENFYLIDSVSVSKKFPDKVIISIKERTPFGIFCKKESGIEAGGGNCAYIDKNGFAYDEAPFFRGAIFMKISKDVSEIKIGSRALEPVLMERMENFAEELKRVTGLETTGFELFSKIPREARVATSEGFKIYLNHDDDFKKVLQVLKTVLDQEIKDKRSNLEYIDLRFGNKVFYKFKNQTANK